MQPNLGLVHYKGIKLSMNIHPSMNNLGVYLGDPKQTLSGSLFQICCHSQCQTHRSCVRQPLTMEG